MKKIFENNCFILCIRVNLTFLSNLHFFFICKVIYIFIYLLYSGEHTRTQKMFNAMYLNLTYPLFEIIFIALVSFQVY